MEAVFGLIDVKLFVMLIFILTYILIIFFYQKKTYVVWGAVIIFLLTFVINPKEAFFGVNWNIMGIFVGVMVLANLFVYSKMPDFLSSLFIRKSKNVGIAILLICFLSGFISIFVENVATVLIVAPVAFVVSKKLKVSPVPFLIGIAISSNLQGAGTLIGDPPSMLLAAFIKMSFNDFFILNGKPSIFFAVEIGAIVSLIVLYFFFRKYKGSTIKIKLEKYSTMIPTYLLVLMVILLALSSFIDPDFSYLPGLICIVLAIVGLIWYYFKTKENPKRMVYDLDWGSVLFIVAIFIIIATLTQTGIIDYITELLIGITGGNVFLSFMIIIWGSVLISAFIDNIPYLAAMIPIAGGLAESLGISPYLLLFGLLIGASIGGNITPIGASANVIAVGMLKKHGYKTSFWDFVRIGLPFTVFSVTAACIFVWFIWA